MKPMHTVYGEHSTGALVAWCVKGKKVVAFKEKVNVFNNFTLFKNFKNFTGKFSEN